MSDGDHESSQLLNEVEVALHLYGRATRHWVITGDGVEEMEGAERHLMRLVGHYGDARVRAALARARGPAGPPEPLIIRNGGGS